MWDPRTLAVLGMALALVASGSAGSATAPSGDSDRRFVSDLVQAFNSKSIEKRIALLHSKSLPCVRADGDSIYRDMFERQARRHVPSNYRSTITPVASGAAPPFGDLFTYPVRPTHVLELTFDTGPSSSTTIVIQLAREGGGWREVIGCAKPGTVAVMRSARAERRKEAQRAQQLAARMAPGLRDSILALFRGGRRVEAYQRYSKATGEDLATSKQVVDLIADRAHLPR
jgi:hypothetical protein